MPETATRARPILFSGPMVRAILEGRKTQTRRVVKPPADLARDGRKSCGPMLYDLSRAWVDRGFPMDENNEVMLTDRWGTSDNPAPESAYRFQYLKVPFAHPSDGWAKDGQDAARRVYCPYGEPGNSLWVRETWRPANWSAEGGWGEVEYAAGGRRQIEGPWSFSRMFPDGKPADRWRPSIHMPRWASRLTLRVEAVRVERVQEISEQDALAEGVDFAKHEPGQSQTRNPPPLYPRRDGFIRLWDSINGPHGFGWDANPWVWVVSFSRLEAAPHA